MKFQGVLKKYYIISRFLFSILIVLFSPLVLLCDDNVSIGLDSLMFMSLEDLMNIKVKVSSVNALDIFNTPSSVTIIDQSKIKKFNFQNIKEVLETVPGIEVYQTIIDRNVTTSRGVLQNFYANKVLLLINNVPTWQPIYGEGAIERISINDVEKIEVLKGPASVLYGSNAYSGVINIILKNNDANKVEAYGKIGLFYEHATGVSANFKLDQFEIYTSFNSEENYSKPISVKSAEGYEYNGESSFNFSDFNNVKNFTLNSKYKRHNMMFNWYNYLHSFQGAHPSYLGGGGNNVSNMGILVNYRYQDNIWEKLDIITNITYDYFERYFPLSYDRVNIIDLAGDRSNGEVIINYLNDGLNLEFGINGEIRKSHGHDTRNGVKNFIIRHNLKNDNDIIEWSTFARIRQKLNQFSLLVGGRYTNNNNFGENFSTRSTLLYSFADKQSLKLIFGQSFRVPTMFELYFDHPTVIGNKNLKPETSSSYEISYLLGTSKFYFQLLGYYAIYKDLIQRITTISGPPSQYQNVEEFEGYGIEAELKFEDLLSIDGYINYNYTLGDDNEINDNFRYVPDHIFSLGLYKNFDKFFISSNGRILSSVNGHLKKIIPQSIFNINIGINSNLNQFHLRHVFGIKNITNSKMLIPEYIRQTPNINDIVTNSFGRMYNYSLFIEL